MSRPRRPWSPGYVLGLVSGRGWNIALRTGHLASTGVLLGGHAFGEPGERLLTSLYLSIGTGVALAVSEAGASWLWFHQLRGLMTLAKVALVCSVAFLWEYRVPILLVVVVIGSVGSHMPARLRYYSLLYGQVIRSGCGPGASQLAADPAGAKIHPSNQDS